MYRKMKGLENRLKKLAKDRAGWYLHLKKCKNGTHRKFLVEVKLGREGGNKRVRVHGSFETRHRMGWVSIVEGYVIDDPYEVRVHDSTIIDITERSSTAVCLLYKTPEEVFEYVRDHCNSCHFEKQLVDMPAVML